MVKRGAALIGTEDSELLMEEYRRLTKPKGRSLSAVKEEGMLYDDLIERRDRFIAQRITETLKEGEVGILFGEVLHRVAERLPEEIEVHHLLRTKESKGDE